VIGLVGCSVGWLVCLDVWLDWFGLGDWFGCFLVGSLVGWLFGWSGLA